MKNATKNPDSNLKHGPSEATKEELPNFITKDYERIDSLINPEVFEELDKMLEKLDQIEKPQARIYDLTIKKAS